ncbi:c-type cytochrome [Neptuniibacter halophilus]|uniref:c-type cytochrome n=1 Tax=Neptuniibacter halophilus TaxID=651666 RepID=UPI002573CF70|nr:cytochrome c [Neptuniibacter halophilus]
MRKGLALSLGLIPLLVVAGISLRPEPAELPSLDGLSGDIKRGAYLARASGCIACHTDFANGGAALAGGAALETPFGRFVAPNLTTDPEHGIGGWSIDDFSRALRHGISPQGEPYYPAFPYTFYTRFSDQDIADLWAAFQTVPPVARKAPQHQLGFPYNLRFGLTLWQGLYFEPQRFQAEADKSEAYNRGAYLVTAASHCAACHTPRNLLGAIDHHAPFSGAGSLLDGGGQVPPITPQALTRNGWTELDLAYALQTGVKHDGDAFGGSMGEVVREGTGFMRKEDLRAIAHYLFNRE